MSKTMIQSTGGHYLRVAMLIAALAAVLFVLILVAVAQTAPTTNDRGNANPAMSADGSGGSGIAQNPYIDRHAEVVARHQGVIPH